LGYKRLTNYAMQVPAPSLGQYSEGSGDAASKMRSREKLPHHCDSLVSDLFSHTPNHHQTTMKLSDVASNNNNNGEARLIDQLKSALDEDRTNYEDGEDWIEAAIDSPSNTVEQLQGQLHELVGEPRFDQIMRTVIIPYMRRLADSD
jgi:hypothetical protein